MLKNEYANYRVVRASTQRGRVSGYSLVESLCALVIFSAGLLGLAATHTVATRQATGAEFRLKAALLAGDLIDRMWLSNRDATTLQANFGPKGPGYSEWIARVRLSGLPNVDARAPEVKLTPVPSSTGAAATTMASITVHWRAPGDTAVHSYTATTHLK